MSYLKQLEKHIQKSNGFILAEDISDKGIPRQYLSDFVNKGKLERVSRGVYIKPNTFKDQMYLLQLRNTRIIYSHETAAYMHGLTDRDPIMFYVTVPYGYNAAHLKDENISVYTVKKDMYETGIKEMDTVFGNKVSLYDKERTVCDVVRNRNNIDVAIVNEVIKNYLNLKDKNIPILLEYAKNLNVLTIVRKYLEILL